MSSTLVSYSSGEEDEDKGKRHPDANYDDVEMDMSDEQSGPENDESGMFSSKEDYEAYRKQFSNSGAKKSNPDRDSVDRQPRRDGRSKRSSEERGSSSSKRESNSEDEKNSRGHRNHDRKRDDDHHRRRRNKDSRHRSRSRSRERAHHRRRSRDKDRDRERDQDRDRERDQDRDRERDQNRDRERDRDRDRHRHREEDRRPRRPNPEQERQDSRNRKLQSLGLIGKKEETYESQLEKVKEMTGVEVPKYYNPAAINPLKYAEQIKKRQMLWAKKTSATDDTTTETQPNQQQQPTSSLKAAFVPSSTAPGMGIKPLGMPTNTGKTLLPTPPSAPVAGNNASGASFNKWESTNFGNNKTNEKFRRLMGIKGGGGSASSTEAAPSTSSANKDMSKFFADQEQHYEKARVITHTQRGLGLGFTPLVAPPGVPPNASGSASSSMSMQQQPPLHDKRDMLYAAKK